MSFKHVQVKLEDYEYSGLKMLADEKHLSLKDAVREAILFWVRNKSDLDKDDPFFKTSGMFSTDEHLSENHDRIYEV
ncbi:MAG: hypothetical protein MIO93_11950 [ANME-2 cluster archaeon]|jgi:hypothetical protein|nr:hypothetical protein [ANME-2 cluster archaeon]